MIRLASGRAGEETHGRAEYIYEDENADLASHNATGCETVSAVGSPVPTERLFEPDVVFPFASDRRDKYPYYASISYGDSLMLMFLELALVLQDREDAVLLQCSIK